MGKKRFKKPEVGKSKRIRQPTETDVIPAEQQHPVFSLRYLQGDYCLTKCQEDQKAAFATKMYRLSQLTWSQIQSQDRHKLGYERISKNSIKAPIPNHIKPDVNLLAFRCFGKLPMLGYREGYVFHVVWLDRNGTLYPHKNG